MTIPVLLMPDAEEMAVAYLAEAFPGAQVSTELWMGFEEEVPVLRVSRVGGAMAKQLILDAPLIDIDVFHGTRAGASQLAREVCAVMPAAKAVEVAGGLITSVTEQLGPSWRPDFNPHVYHFGCQFVLTIRPV